MNDRATLWLYAVLSVVVLMALPDAGSAQTPDLSPPRLADGRPDLSGVWDFRTATPLERPGAFADRETLTEEEAAAFEALAAGFQNAADAPPREGSVGAYNAFWLDFGTTIGADRASSLIVDPPDGRLPPLNEGVTRQIGSLDEDLPGSRPVRVRSAGISADGPEDRGLAERCLVGFNSGPPMMPSAYNNNVQLFQNEDHVVILNEMVHDARIVPLSGLAHLPDGIRQWSGNSRGHWEGDTLVIETRNFTDKTGGYDPNALVAIGSGSTVVLTERLTRVDEAILRYEYTVDDPTTFARSFTAVVPMKRSGDDIFEYACHEGNYGMVNLLSGARATEIAAR